MSQIIAIIAASTRPHVTITMDTMKNLFSRLKLYELDVAVVEAFFSPDLVSVLLDTDSLCLCLGEHPLAEKRRHLPIFSEKVHPSFQEPYARVFSQIISLVL